MDARIWSQGIARRSLLGEPSKNPTLAAAMLLRRGFGRKRVARAVKALSRVRRRFHRGNPLPAAAALAAASKLGLGGLFKTPSEKRAGKVVGAVVASAVNGNLTAAKAILERTEIGISKERAVWRSAWAQVPQKVKTLLKQYGELVPGVDHTNPETAAETALSRAVDANELERAAEEEAAQLKSERAAAARERAAAGERREARLLDVGGQIGAAILGRGRSRRRRTTRRRRSSPRGRSFSF